MSIIINKRQWHFEMFKYLVLVVEYLWKLLPCLLSKQNRISFFSFYLLYHNSRTQFLMKFHSYFNHLEVPQLKLFKILNVVCTLYIIMYGKDDSKNMSNKYRVLTICQQCVKCFKNIISYNPYLTLLCRFITVSALQVGKVETAQCDLPKNTKPGRGVARHLKWVLLAQDGVFVLSHSASILSQKIKNICKSNSVIQSKETSNFILTFLKINWPLLDFGNPWGHKHSIMFYCNKI